MKSVKSAAVKQIKKKKKLTYAKKSSRGYAVCLPEHEGELILGKTMTMEEVIAENKTKK